jgi:hypothetical protein
MAVLQILAVMVVEVVAREALAAMLHQALLTEERAEQV